MVGAQISAGGTAPIERLVRSSGPQGNAIKGGALLAVAVLSGLVWWLIRHDDAGEQEAAAAPPATAGEFAFQPTARPVTGADCAGNSYGQIKTWFAEHPCTSLSRSLHITESGGTRALVSVSVVTMPAPETAQQLKTITDTDDTGNVTDLVKAGSANIPGAPKVAEGEYTSKVTGSTVTIVEANLFDGKKDDVLLKRITADAVRLGEQQG